MNFMNSMEIECAVTRFAVDTARGKAARLLRAHMDAVDSNSDGWAYWRAPVLAAKRLMELVQAPSTISEVTAAECLKRALPPLRAFYTKHPQLPRPESLAPLSVIRKAQAMADSVRAPKLPDIEGPHGRHVQTESLAESAPDHYIVEVIADASGKWCSNALTFKTKPEAETYARDLMSRWTLVTAWRVVGVRTVQLRTYDESKQFLQSLARWRNSQ
jgi:hypothetical protein